MVIPTLKTCYFEASEDIMTKFKSQALHIIRIKYWKASGSGNPPSFIPALRKIAILGLKTKFYVLFCTRLHQYYLAQYSTTFLTIGQVPSNLSTYFFMKCLWNNQATIRMVIQRWYQHKCQIELLTLSISILPLTILVTFCNISVVKGSRMGNVNAFQAISTSSNKADRLLTWLIETVVSSPSTAFSHCSMYLDNSGSLKSMEGKS